MTSQGKRVPPDTKVNTSTWKPHLIPSTNNKTGSSQVGAISKAQKYSKNNYWKHLEKLFFSKKKF